MNYDYATFVFVLEGDVLYPAVCNEMYDHNT